MKRHDSSQKPDPAKLEKTDDFDVSPFLSEPIDWLSPTCQANSYYAVLSGKRKSEY